jgi:hypothetical protein
VTSGIGRRARTSLVTALGAALVLAACGSDTPDTPAAVSVGQPPTGGIAGPPAPDDAQGIVLRAPAGTSAEMLAAAAAIVEDRLLQMGVTDAGAASVADGLVVTGSADGYQLRAAAQRHATTIAPVTSASLGECGGSGAASVGPATRCYELGPELTGVGANTIFAVR